MSILRRAAAPAEHRAAFDQLGAQLAQAGIPTRSASTAMPAVTPLTALKHPTVNAAVNLLANMATWPVHGYRTYGQIKRQLDVDPPILRMPSADRTALEWRRELLVGWLTEGNTFGIVARTAGTFPTQIELIPGSLVKFRPKGRDGRGGWDTLVDGKPMPRWPDGPLWHTRGLWTRPGWPIGISPVEMACDAIGLGLLAQEFGARWFVDGAVPSALLYTDQAVTPEVAAVVKKRFIDAVRGKREPAVLGAGLKYQQVSVSANESQFLETLDANKGTVANFFLIPAELVGATSGNSMTYSNVESRNLALLQQAYHPWLAKYESTLTDLVIRPVYVKASTDVLLRLDALTSARVMDMELRNGTLGRDEARALRDRPPVSETDDTLLWPPYRAFPVPSDEEA